MKKVLIVSPHLDDAVLSCGDLINKLINDNNIVDVITVFSKDEKKENLSDAAKKFHSNCFLPSNPMIERKKEDRKAHNYLKCKSHYMDYLECLYRKHDNKHLYPDLNNIYHLEDNDKKIIKDVEKSLSKIINNYDIILAPLGLGGHADHLVCNKAINNIKNIIKGKLYFYEEVAYVCYYYRDNEKSNWGKGLKNMLIEIRDDNFNKKINSILMYRSQLNILWSDYNQMYNDLDSFSKKYDKNRSVRLWYYEDL
jgi:LmbE family N-acetylglucosaminyl deacetylase